MYKENDINIDMNDNYITMYHQNKYLHNSKIMYITFVIYIHKVFLHKSLRKFLKMQSKQ